MCLRVRGRADFTCQKDFRLAVMGRTLVQLYTVTGVPLLTASEHSYCQHGTLVWALRLLVPFQRDYNSVAY